MTTNHKPVILLGAGGHSRVLRSLLSIQERSILAVLDDNPDLHGKRIGHTGLTIAAALDAVRQHDPNDVELVNAIGSTHRPTARRAVYETFTAKGYTFATLIHHHATTACEAFIEPSAQLMAGCTIQAGAQILANTLINTHASIDHDTTVGEHTHVAPGVTICGNVTIGQACHIGAGATIVQGITIGDSVVVGAGATVLRDVPDTQTVLGTPARPIA
ncbi:MAG: acetyltransferase [Phycisphaeraceae bacterium]